MQLRIVRTLADVDAAAWDALTGDNDPFVEHAFLRLLEDCGAACPERGWQPLHLTLWQGERLCAALPLYAKGHSFGEYIFDWAWADAAERAGLPYYPKLLSMVPFTPASGRRLLHHPDVPLPKAAVLLLGAAYSLAQQSGCHSLHLLFLSAPEMQAAASSPLLAEGKLLPRLTQQVHWHNPGYRDFTDHLDAMRSACRKQVRKERRRAAEAGLALSVVPGTALDGAAWQRLSDFYADTCARKGSPTYLPPSFFTELGARLAGRTVVARAERQGQMVAASLNFCKGDTLYGRYWGASEHVDALHFELCFHRLIDYAIAHGLRRFEAGAGIGHKLKRGLMPAATHSLHWLRHPGLHDAVAEALVQERAGVASDMQLLAAHGVFRRV
ncbi:MAG: GNAT family N-acetyltransferase [Polyangiales bacterium]